MEAGSDYGVWWLVLVNSVFFIVFALSFTRPRTGRDWRSLGAFSAFIVALFAEMYGFPLSIYLLSGWLASHYPEIDPFAHDTGHFWHTLLDRQGPAHSDPLHIFSEVLVFAGLILLAVSWRVLYWAQREHDPGHDRTLCLDETSTVHRLHRDHAGLPAPMADPSDIVHVSCARGAVRPSCPHRGGRGPYAVRRGL